MNVAGPTTQPSNEKSAVQIGKPEAALNTKGFQSLLANAISKEDTAPGTASKGAKPTLPASIAAAMPESAPSDAPIAPPAPKKAPGKPAGDLSFLGESMQDAKKPALKLDDLLAGLSHESQAPQGTSLINFKTVLGAKNDDPALLNSDLIALVPPEQQKETIKGLITGAKALLKDKLNAHIPAERVPNTLKGMVETAIAFDIPIDDVKLETIPANNATKNLLALFEQSQNASVPVPKHKVHLGTQIIDPQAVAATVREESTTASPLAKLLEQPLAPAVSQNGAATPKMIKDEKDKPKSAAKEEGIKMDPLKTDLLADTKAPAPEGTKVASIKNEHSPLEQMLQADETAQESHAERVKGEEPHLGKSELKSKESSLDFKNVEARQLMSRLSADVREAIENYKPPFTKLTLKLTPERLGEIDVTMVQRGSNVHINLSSNTVVLTMLQQQSSELKAALAEAGLGDTSMNFSQSNDSQTKQQMQRQHLTRDAYEKMAEIAAEYDKLEIVVPRYV